MSRLPVAGRIGALVATGALGVGLVSAGTASAKSVPSKCPTESAVSKAVGVKMTHQMRSKPGHNLECSYYNKAGTVFVDVDTLKVGNEKTSIFYSSWAKTAKDNKSKFTHFKAGRAAGYFTQKGDTIDHHKTLEAEVLDGKEQLTVSINSSAKKVKSLARHFS
jgi:hypothetical protein